MTNVVQHKSDFKTLIVCGYIKDVIDNLSKVT